MELAYHYIWKHRLFPSEGILRDGRKVKIISPGIHNTDAGPDFSHARIVIDGKEWIGNIEIHIKASDWFRHSHHKDAAYDNIILHVVAVDDTEIYRSSGVAIPQLLIPLQPDIMKRIAALTESIDAVSCRNSLSSFHPLQISDWLESLSTERLHSKGKRILDMMQIYGGDWRQVMFITLARGLGFGLNSIPFELLAKSIPLNYLLRHSDNFMQIEAFLFGQAGMLDSSCNIFDEYFQSLCREYLFLSRKYNLRPINVSLWKFARTRPSNFPHRRIALLARHVAEGCSLTDKLISAKGDPESLIAMFQWETGPYWRSHQLFGVTAENLSCKLSLSSIQLLLINVVAPFYMAYAAWTGDYEKGEVAVNLLQNLPAESNSIIKEWCRYGIKPSDASHSQALLQLRKEYCDRGRCLECRFGHRVIRHSLPSTYF